MEPRMGRWVAAHYAADDVDDNGQHNRRDTKTRAKRCQLNDLQIAICDECVIVRNVDYVRLVSRMNNERSLNLPAKHEEREKKRNQQHYGFI